MKELRRKKPTVITSAFIEKDGKFLIIFCPKFKTWRVPGGRVEFDEALEECLAREMEEETGIKIKNPVFLGYGQDWMTHKIKNKKTSRLILYFHVKTKQKIVLDPNEAEDHRWVTLAELKKLKNKEYALTDFFERNPGFKL